MMDQKTEKTQMSRYLLKEEHLVMGREKGNCNNYNLVRYGRPIYLERLSLLPSQRRMEKEQDLEKK